MNAEKHIHIIAFNVPYPANYGGVIDVFYKLKALHAMGVKIHLHCFTYGRNEVRELEVLCDTVKYYPRKTGLFKALSLSPYIVNTRQSKELLQNLLKDNYPILFECLHSCYYLSDKRLSNRLKIYRESNIEHEYYQNLCTAEKNLLKKLYFALEAWKLKRFEKQLQYADYMLAVSKNDQEKLIQTFPHNKVIYLPSFHPNIDLHTKAGKGAYALYHGNLSVAENHHAAAYLIKQVFSQLQVPFTIAGLNPPAYLVELAAQYPHLKLIPNPSDTEMRDLIINAQMNVLVTFQPTGLKLKLLNVLHNGRFCIVNPEMLSGTGLDELCIIANDAQALKTAIAANFETSFDKATLNTRTELLSQHYSNRKNAELLCNLVLGVNHPA